MKEFYSDVYSEAGPDAEFAGTPYPGERYEGCYINYPDRDMLAYKFWPQLYYGTGDLYPFLQDVKRSLRPEQCFPSCDVRQSISPDEQIKSPPFPAKLQQSLSSSVLRDGRCSGTPSLMWDSTREFTCIPSTKPGAVFKLFQSADPLLSFSIRSSRFYLRPMTSKSTTIASCHCGSLPYRGVGPSTTSQSGRAFAVCGPAASSGNCTANKSSRGRFQRWRYI